MSRLTVGVLGCVLLSLVEAGPWGTVDATRLPALRQLHRSQAMPSPHPLDRLRGGAAAPEASWLSILPPVVALGASVALKQVIVALILGVWTGCMVINQGRPALSLLRVFDRYLVRALADGEHAGVLLFTLLLGGTIGIVQRAGGGLGLARLLSAYMTSAASALTSAWALCCMIFFDDYSSVLIVGSSLRPVLPRVGVAPERLALIVHTMGVVLASLSPISSWIGLQLGYVAGVYKQVGSSADPFLATMSTLPYRFFPVLMLVLIPALLATQKDLGPMAAYPLLVAQPTSRGRPPRSRRPVPSSRRWVSRPRRRRTQRQTRWRTWPRTRRRTQ